MIFGGAHARLRWLLLVCKVTVGKVRVGALEVVADNRLPGWSLRMSLSSWSFVSSIRATAMAACVALNVDVVTLIFILSLLSLQLRPLALLTAHGPVLTSNLLTLTWPMLSTLAAVRYMSRGSVMTANHLSSSVSDWLVVQSGKLGRSKSRAHALGNRRRLWSSSFA